MIPISLKIKGLYSYKKEQTINFKNLTESSIFGIFGKVGSGKSSILEAITFALYGQVERLNKNDGIYKNMMNLMSDELLISFECLCGSDEKAYRFDVSSKKDKKGEAKTAVRNAYMLSEFDNQWVTVEWEGLAEKIIGLPYDHFKKTIIIPQGQFMDFIELPPKKRTEMMNKLFGLEKFDLSNNVSEVLKIVGHEISNLEGQITALGNVTLEQIEAEKHNFKLQNDLLGLQSKEFERVSKIVAELDNIKKLFEAINILKIKVQNLESQQDKFAARTRNLAIYSTCKSNIKPIFEQVQNEEISLKKLDKSLVDNGLLLKEIYKDLIVQQKLYEDSKPFFENLDTNRRRVEEFRIVNEIKDLESKYKPERVDNGKKHIEKLEVEIKDLSDKKQQTDENFQIWRADLESKKVIEEIDAKIVGFKVKSELQSYAENLKPGEACPLCGSTEHPAVLHESNDFLERIKFLENQKGELKKKELEFDSAIKNCQKAIEEKQNLVLKFNQDIQKIDAENQQFLGMINGKKSTLTHLYFEDYENTSKPGIEDLIKKELDKISKIENTFRNAETYLKTNQPEQTRLETIIQKDSETKVQAEINLSQNKQKLAELLQQNNIDSVEVLTRILSQNLNEEAERKAITDFEIDLKTNQNLLKEKETESKGQTFDAEQFNAVLTKKNELENHVNSINQEIGKIDRNIKDFEQKQAKLEELDKHLKLKELRQESFKELSKLFYSAGFVDYISSIYLRNLCEAGNDRFSKMTKNVLHLSINEENDFIVIDQLNGGKTRLLKTLSGGQKFQASLALALALSDNIHQKKQSKNKFFFLDEGFGSLDKDSLQDVLGTLKSLKKENRIVGIISHVEELQQQIPTYITVKNTDEGTEIHSDF